MPDQSLVVGRTVELNLATLFANPGGVSLRFRAETSDSNVVAVTLAGAALKLHAAGGEGSADVTVTASDPAGRFAIVSFAVIADYGDSIAAAAAVSIGDTMRGSLTRQDQDYFEFDVPADGFAVRAFAQGDTDTDGVLYDTNGTVLAEDYWAGEGSNFHIVREVDAGTYYLSVSGWPGRYTLVLEEAGPDDHGDSIEAATSVSVGDTVPGVLTPGDQDYFEFSVPTDGFRLGALTQETTDTFGELYDGDGSSIGYDDDAGEGENFHIVRELDAGTYYLGIVGESRRESGYYTLILEEAEADDHGNSIASATTVSIGDTVQAVLTAADEDYFEFSVPTDGFRLSAFTEGDTHTLGILYDADGSRVAYDSWSGEGDNFHIIHLLASGTYYLGVRGGLGSYSLILKEAEPDDHGDGFGTATAVSVGDTVPGVLQPQDRDYFKFSISTDGFRLRAFALGDTDTDGVLYDGSGAWLDSDQDSGEGRNFHIVRELEAGTYYLAVVQSPYSNRTVGNYSLVLEEG